MNNSIDQQFIEYIVRSLVSNPDAVVIERRIDEKGVLLELTVDPEDLGRVIGKRGATAQSIRTLLRALGTKNDARYNLKIVDNGVGGNDAQNAGTDDNGSQQSTVADDAVSAGSAAATSNGSTAQTAESDMVSKTRRELAEYDDLDV